MSTENVIGYLIGILFNSAGFFNVLMQHNLIINPLFIYTSSIWSYVVTRCINAGTPLNVFPPLKPSVNARTSFYSHCPCRLV